MAMMRPNDTQPAGIVSVAILNDKLNAVLAVDKEKSQMRVGPGMDLNQLFKHATANNMSVQVRAGCLLCRVFWMVWTRKFRVLLLQQSHQQ